MRRLAAAFIGCIAASLLPSYLIVGVPVEAANPSADLDQCRNGAQDAPVACTGSAWVNGNAGQSNAHWLEGDSIAYRMRFSNLATGGTHHLLIIEWDTTQQGKHAIDYLTSYNRTMNGAPNSLRYADPCSGVSGCGSPMTFPIPQDINTLLPPDPGSPPSTTGRWDQVFTMYNGTILGLGVAPFYSVSGSYAGSSSTRITIEFTATTASPVLAWGGHIATRADWGTGNSAVAINGSPYHMRLIDLDGSGGNQDRSLSSAAVIFPAKLTIIKTVKDVNGNVITSDPTSFGFTTTTNPTIPGDGTQLPATFSLVGNGVDKRTADLVLFGSANKVVVTEDATSAAYTLDSVTCVDSDGGLGFTADSAGSISLRTATIISQEAELITCTFVNKVQAAKLTVKKHVITDNGGSASASSFTMHIKSGGVDSVTAFAGSESGSQYSLAAGTYIVSEDALTGYTQTSISGDCNSTTGSITLAAGDVKECTITNDDDAAHLIIIKVVTNDNGGSKIANQFELTIGGVTASGGQVVTGTESPGVDKTLTTIGAYTVTEGAHVGYDVSYSADCNGNIALGQTKTCTVTNDDKPNDVTVVTLQRVILHDRAKITGILRNSDESSSKVTFQLYQTNNAGNCEGEVGTGEEVNVNFGSDTSSTEITVGTSTGVAVELNAPGTQTTVRYWRAFYSGNTLKANGKTLNSAKATPCNEITSVTLTQ